MKALEILLNGIALMEEHIKSNPMSEKEIRNEIEIYKEAVKEIEELQSLTKSFVNVCQD